ncbi:MAG: hypothetical protein R8M45_03675 [Ghiorsea sp.]
MSKLTKLQNLKIIINKVCFYTTPKAIRNGLGDHYTTNAASQKCLFTLEQSRTENKANGQSLSLGLAGSWEGFNVQIDIL